MFFDMNDEIEKIINEQNGLDARLFELVSASMATENIEQQNAAILKAADYIRKKNSKSEGKSFMISPNVGNVNGHVESYNALPLDYCRRLCQTPIPRAIVSTRVEKIAHYCTPVYDENEDGFTVVIKVPFLSPLSVKSFKCKVGLQITEKRIPAHHFFYHLFPTLLQNLHTIYQTSIHRSAWPIFDPEKLEGGFAT
jgi:hypothetical protein